MLLDSLSQNVVRSCGMKVGISGAKGSFSEEASHFYCDKNGIDDVEREYLIHVENVLTAIENGSIDLGIFAIENSNGGVVIEYLPSIARHRFKIEDIFEIDVHHNLLVVQGTIAKDITTITTQDQAMRQCRTYIKRKWPNVEFEEYEDTAKAAEDLGNGTLPPTTAVIAPKGCAKLYDLEILEESIQDLKFNFTTFLAVTKLED